ncbi:MAG: UDP-glucose--hexose-1-phosphate uridylyltransferase [Ruminococcus sp.]|jgi:UTP--hexose-1-phosphate uridylyltransferase|nr:UDP-glucose--hexose-1-phosphate uridylyltransferase [Ruminococcus sp.]
MINTYIAALAAYGLKTGLITADDRIFAINSILAALGLDDYEEPENIPDMELEEILKGLLDFACSKNIIPDSIAYRDLFDTKLMACLTPRPSEVIARFKADYAVSPVTATDNYYKLSRNTDYIRRYRIAKDIKWKTETEYGELDITINLSKPEKDPKAIAAAKNAKQSGYPKCLLCPENVGYAGRLNHPARQNHRIIPVDICGEPWGFQYSPYVYYNEHCILFNTKHTPMVIDKKAFEKLFDFVSQFPHYFIGSNADLPIVGGSILSHEHFQGGNYTFAMAKANIEKEYKIKGFEDVTVGRVKWPMSVIRLRSADTGRLVELADIILTKWRGYTDEAAFIFAETDGEPHNTITPIARKNGDMYELDLVLRNNITTEEHPLGVYHPHAELHHIKKENIGLIEVMGLAVLPARLKNEMQQLADVLVTKGVSAVRSDPVLEKHADWAEEFCSRRTVNADSVHEVIRDEIGKVFAKVLEHAGVYKRTPEGEAAFDRFVEYLNK